MEDMHEELALIKKRNIRVEADKAWETSRTRKISFRQNTY